MTVSRGFLKSNCSHTTNSLTYCRRTYLLDIACFERAPTCALSMSRAIVLCYFYKASEGLCRTHVRKSLLGFLNHTLLKIYICSIQRICITSTSILFRRFNRLFVFIACIFNKVSPCYVIHQSLWEWALSSAVFHSFFFFFFPAQLIYCLHWMTLNNFPNHNIKTTNKEPK